MHIVCPKKTLFFATLFLLMLFTPFAVFASEEKDNQLEHSFHEIAAQGAEQTATITPDICGFGCGMKIPTDTTALTEHNEGQIQFEPGLVKFILFWMQGCPNCDKIISNFLPQLEERYGDTLDARTIELVDVADVDLLYSIGREQGLDNEEIGVPFLMIGDDILTGYTQITAELSNLIERYLQQGGVGYPDHPHLSLLLPVSSSTTKTSFAVPSQTQEPAASPLPNAFETKIYLFWGDGCPHCARAEAFLDQLTQANPNISLQAFEIYHIAENQILFRQFAALFGFEPYSVPTIFLGDEYWVGFSDSIQSQIETAVQNCLEFGCPDRGERLLTKTDLEETIPAIPTTETDAASTGANVIDIPLVGKIDLSRQSLLISTLLISFVDGFNPCSIWVLSILLAMTLQTQSRKKVLIIGLVFISVTAFIYALFIAGLFTVLTFVNFTGWIQVIVALVALFFALVNIKDYFWYKEGLSFTIDDQKKPGIYKRMRSILNAGDSIWGLVGGTIVLAAGVSIVEFSCTAGFPVIWTNLLSAQQVPFTQFLLLLLVYMLIYQLDELGIFLAAVFTLRSSKLEEKHGRLLKLVGGMLMLTLAVVMLVKPSLMNELSSSLIIFGAAFGATLLLLLVHRYILPRLGIHLGSEFSRSKSKKRHR